MATQNLITVEQFNKAVQDWSISIRNKARKNAPIGLDSLSDGDKLSFTKSFVNKDKGVAEVVKFDFDRHGVFVHYGVGRGYIREGDQIVRGRRATTEEQSQKLKRGYSRKEAAKMKIAYASGEIKRKAVDWIDVEIRTGIKDLAEIAQEFYGDKALEKVLEMVGRATIEKK